MMKTQMAGSEEMTGEMNGNPKSGHLKIKWVHNRSPFAAHKVSNSERSGMLYYLDLSVGWEEKADGDM